jgi:hypothetical protein
VLPQGTGCIEFRIASAGGRSRHFAPERVPSFMITSLVPTIRRMNQNLAHSMAGFIDRHASRSPT